MKFRDAIRNYAVQYALNFDSELLKNAKKKCYEQKAAKALSDSRSYFINDKDIYLPLASPIIKSNSIEKAKSLSEVQTDLHVQQYIDLQLKWS